MTMEAMACGCKVVCSQIPGMEEWLDEHVPGQQVEFVPLPEMTRVDEPKEKNYQSLKRNWRGNREEIRTTTRRMSRFERCLMGRHQSDCSGNDNVEKRKKHVYRYAHARIDIFKR